MRELIVDAIPLSLQHAISVGIGLFIAFIGLQGVGIIVHDKSTLVTLGNLGSSSALICFFGLIVSGVLLALRVKGALLIGIFSSTVLALFMGDASLPHTALIQTPPSMAPTFLKFEWTHVFTVDMAAVLFTFLFVDLFDTIGTLVGVASQAKMLDAKGRFPHVNRALLADAVSIPSASVYRSLGEGKIIHRVYCPRNFRNAKANFSLSGCLEPERLIQTLKNQHENLIKANYLIFHVRGDLKGKVIHVFHITNCPF